MWDGMSWKADFLRFWRQREMLERTLDGIGDEMWTSSRILTIKLSFMQIVLPRMPQILQHLREIHITHQHWFGVLGSGPRNGANKKYLWKHPPTPENVVQMLLDILGVREGSRWIWSEIPSNSFLVECP